MTSFQAVHALVEGVPVPKPFFILLFIRLVFVVVAEVWIMDASFPRWFIEILLCRRHLRSVFDCYENCEVMFGLACYSVCIEIYFVVKCGEIGDFDESTRFLCVSYQLFDNNSVNFVLAPDKDHKCFLQIVFRSMYPVCRFERILYITKKRRLSGMFEAELSNNTDLRLVHNIYGAYGRTLDFSVYGEL